MLKIFRLLSYEIITVRSILQKGYPIFVGSTQNISFQLADMNLKITMRTELRGKKLEATP